MIANIRGRFRISKGVQGASIVGAKKSDNRLTTSAHMLYLGRSGGMPSQENFCKFSFLRLNFTIILLLKKHCEPL